MNIQALKASLTLHEGKSFLPYPDTEGVETIGVGHNLQRPISEAAVQQILSDDINTAVAELDRAFKGWRNHSEARQTVLVELMFAMGAPSLSKFVKFWAAMDRKDYTAAAAQLIDSKWATQVGDREIGLARRLEEDTLV